MNYRNPIYDIQRGIVAFIMVAANAAPMYNPEFPFWIRLLFSIPAPVFVTISGLMIGYHYKEHNLTYYLKRGGFIISIGVLIDCFINGIIPFQGFDVLYLIGISLPITYLVAKRCNYSSTTLLILLILVVSSLAMSIAGYSQFHHFTSLNNEQIENVQITTSVPYHWLVDGWFPIFPWLALMLIGMLIGKMRAQELKTKMENSKNLIIKHKVLDYIGYILLIVGSILWFAFPTKSYSRYGYAELFYPPDTQIIIFMTGLFIIMLSVLEKIKNFSLVKIFEVPGQMILAVYIIHLLIISLTEHIVPTVNSLDMYFAIFLYHASLVAICVRLISSFKKNYKKLPYLLTWIIGK